MKHFTSQNKPVATGSRLAANSDQLIVDKKKTLLTASREAWDAKFRLWMSQAASVAMIMLVAFLFTGIEKANAQFKSGTDIAVYVAAASASNTTATIVELSTTTPGSNPVSTQTVPSTLRVSGSAGTTMYLANSNDGSLVCFNGADTTSTGGNVNAVYNRSVGTFNSLGNYNVAASYILSSVTGGFQSRGSTSLNNSTCYIADQSGVYTNGANLASPSGNFLCARAFGGVVYMGTASSVSTISAPSGGTLTALNGLTTGTITDFYLVSSGSNGSSFDVLYTVNNSSATAGTIAKYSLVSGSWTSNGSYSTSFGGCRLAAQAGGGGAYIYVTSGVGTTVQNSIIKLNDVNGWNASISITTGNNVTLYTCGSAATIKGVAFAPLATVSVTPTSLSFANTVAGSTSTSSSFTLSSSNLIPSTGGNITVTAPSTDFQVSSDNSTWGATATIAYTSASLSAPIYVRFSPQTSGSKSGNVTFSGTNISSGVGTSPVTVAVSGLSPAPPTQFVITNVSPASPLQNGLFSVTVTAEDASNGIQNVQSTTNVSLAVTTGSSTLSGTTSGQITTGNSSITFTGLSYSVAENIVITASGDLSSGSSSSITIQAVATHLAFVNIPTSGVVNTTIATFTVNALKDDGTIDANYTSNITITQASGSGTLSGTLTQPAVAGVATFNDLQFNAADTYTITAASGSFTSITSGNIVIIGYPSTLVHYWDFNSTSPCKGGGGVAVTPLNADYSLFSAGSAKLTWVDTSTTGVRDSIIDNGQYGTTLNERDNTTLGVDTGTCTNEYIRVRNPSSVNLFNWYLPTTGYKHIVLKYTTETSSLSSGQLTQHFRYSLDGTNFITTCLPATSFTNTAASAANFVLVTVDLTAISGVNNNPNFVFQMTFTGGNSATPDGSGNNRFDNITLEGDSICPVALLPSASSTITNTCPGTSNGSIAISASGGAGSYTYSWSNSSTTSSISNVPAGPYSVTVTDANGCAITANDTVGSLAAPAPIITGPLSICPSATGILDAGAGYNTYSWNTTATTETISVTSAGTYSVTVTNSNGCTGTASATVSETTNLNPVISGAPYFCAGSSTTLSSSGYDTYSWTGGGTASSTVVSTAGDYTLNVTLGTCTGSTTVYVNEDTPPSVQATPSSTNPFCAGQSLTLTASGASTYSWSPVVSTASAVMVSPAGSTNYSVTGTSTYGDGNSCSTVATYSVTVNPLPTVTASANPNVICAGGSSTLTASSGTATSYAWSPSSGLSNTPEASETATPTSNTTYTVTVADANGCINTDSAGLTVIPAPPVPATNTTITLCQGTAASALSATPNPSTAALLWYTTPSGGTGSTTAPTPSTTDVGATDYYVSETFSSGVQIAIDGINGNTTPTKEFTFLALSDIPAGTVIYFTNNFWTGTAFNGYIADSALQGAKNINKFIANNTISAGRVIVSYDSVSANHTDFSWVISGAIDGVNTNHGVFNTLGLAAAGTQLFAFQSNVPTDPIGNPSNFLFAFANNLGAENLSGTGLSAYSGGSGNGTFVAFGNWTKIYLNNDGQTRSAYEWYQYMSDTTHYTKGNSGTDLSPSSFTVASTCTSMESPRVAIEVDVNGAPDPGLLVEPGDISENSLAICSTGQTIDLLVDENGFYSSYSWTGPNGYNNSNNEITIPDATSANSGTYTGTVTDFNGCSASQSISVTVGTPSTSSTTASACGSYLWNGTTYSSSGTETYQTTNASGCDSTATLVLTIGTSTTSTTNVTTCGSYLWNGTTYTSNTNTTIHLTNAAGCDSAATLNLTITGSCTATVNLKMFIQGYYLGSGTMQKVLYKEGIELNSNSTDVDTVTVSLVDSALIHNDPQHNLTDADTVATAKGILQTNGSLTVSFPGSVAGNNYFLMVTHRNTVRTYSALTVTISNGLTYDFTSAAGATYGSNVVNNGDGTYSFYSGDINQSGGIDIVDFGILDPDIIGLKGGYLVTDLDGNGGVDVLDFGVLDPNIIKLVGSVHP